MKNRRTRILLLVALALVLVATVVTLVTLHDRAEQPAAAQETTAVQPVAETPTMSAHPTETPAPETSAVPSAAPSDAPETTAPPVPSAPPETPEPQPETVSLTIVCTNALASDALPEGVRAVLPAGGVLLQTTVALESGDTVWTLTRRACQSAGIAIEASFAAAQGAVYVEGIGQLYEFDCGEGSGWIYKVNASAPGRGCDGYALNPGDTLVWAYTCNYGNDV